MKKNILFRVDGGVEIGLGHVVRCLAMAQMLMDDYQITFIYKEMPQQIEKKFVSLGFEILKINDESLFFNTLKGTDIVVIDHYRLSTEDQKCVKSKGCKLICIVDLNDKSYYADLLINHAPNVDTFTYDVQSYTKFAFGLDYALLRPSFLAQLKKERVVEKIESIFICFGGADLKNLTCSTLEVCIKLNNKNIILVTGSAYRYLDELHLLISQNQNIHHYHDISEIEMSNVMQLSDLAIVPASGVLFEALASGCIILTSYYVDNQKAIFDGFRGLKNACFLESFKGLSLDFLSDFIANYNPIISLNPIDGHSNLRIKQLIDQL